MTILLLAGSPAVGHNTIADLLIRRRLRLAVIDLDDLRDMVRRPLALPWQSGEGEQQYAGAIRRACLLARDFHSDDFDVLLLDVAPPETLPLFQKGLAGLPAHKVLLLAPAEVLIARDRERDPNPQPDPTLLKAWHDRIRALQHQLQEAAHLYDSTLDNSSNDPELTVQALSALLDH